VLTSWTLDPIPLAAIAVGCLAYIARLRALRSRRVPVPRMKQLALAASVVVLIVAVASPIDRIGEERLFSVHMLQHLLIGDLAPLLVVLSLSGPLLRPLLAAPLASRLRFLAQPLIALPLWAMNLTIWHVPLLYDAALERPALHAVEHALFFTGGVFLWATILEVLPGPRWYGTGAKLASLAIVWLVGGLLANIFLWSSHAFYLSYRSAPRLWGLTAVADQRIGGGLMLLEMTVVVLPVSLLLGLRWLRESDRQQQLIEAGWKPARAARAVRYGAEADLE
jgi:cytochrome c oxidase assembly factor CtaG